MEPVCEVISLKGFSFSWCWLYLFWLVLWFPLCKWSVFHSGRCNSSYMYAWGEQIRKLETSSFYSLFWRWISTVSFCKLELAISWNLSCFKFKALLALSFQFYDRRCAHCILLSSWVSLWNLACIFSLLLELASRDDLSTF